MTMLLVLEQSMDVLGFSSGAPQSACDNMRPNHQLGTVETTPPFTVNVNSDTYSQNSILTGNVH